MNSISKLGPKSKGFFYLFGIRIVTKPCGVIMSDSKMLEIADENQKVMLALFQELDALVIKADVTGVHETVRKILDAKENFYEKLWKDFCSLQRGDASKLVQQAEKATKLE